MSISGDAENGRLLIGQVAERAGVNVQTLRYYERRGLLAEPDRNASGYRLYPAETIRIIRFVKRAQQLGFTLDEIERLLDLRTDTLSSCDEVQALAESKLASIESRIEDLTGLKGALEKLVRSCQEGGDRECPILEAIGRDDLPVP